MPAAAAPQMEAVSTLGETDVKRQSSLKSCDVRAPWRSVVEGCHVEDGWLHLGDM